MTPINAEITISARYEDAIIIKVHDIDSSTTFVELTLTREQFINAAMNRLSNCGVEKASVMHLDRVGKTMELKSFEFELPEGVDYTSNEEEICRIARQTVPEGWTPDLYFRSQNSFFKKDKKHFARTTIRRWV